MEESEVGEHKGSIIPALPDKMQLEKFIGQWSRYESLEDWGRRIRRETTQNKEFWEKAPLEEQHQTKDLIGTRDRIIESRLSPHRAELWATICRYPIVTHATSTSRLSKIFADGLLSASKTRQGNYDMYDEKFPELGLRDVIHCSWGGIDPFAGGTRNVTGAVVLLIDPKAVQPSHKVTGVDWSIWGSTQILKSGGNERTKKLVVQDYLRQLRPASDYKMNPYSDLQNSNDPLEFLYTGKTRMTVGTGVLEIPTILIPYLNPDQIRGMVMTQKTLEQEAKNLEILPKVSLFTWEQLAEVDLVGSDKFGYGFAKASPRARYAQSQIEGTAEDFKKNLTSGGKGSLDKYLLDKITVSDLNEQIAEIKGQALKNERESRGEGRL